MTRRHELQQQLHGLDEIRNIVAAMKNLALFETRKLGRYLTTQRDVVAGIESAAMDFFDFYPASPPETPIENDACVLVGSERGFCGNFNEQIIEHFESGVQRPGGGVRKVIAVGGKLVTRLADITSGSAGLDGANVTEEVPRVLAQVVQTLSGINGRQGPLRLSVVYQSSRDELVQDRQILPPVVSREGRRAPFRHPPMLNLTPQAFVAELLDHFVFAALHEVFYDSLMAENQRRVQHMMRAMDRLEQRATEASVRYHAVRQEEITEEIEGILLSAMPSPYDWKKRD